MINQVQAAFRRVADRLQKSIDSSKFDRPGDPATRQEVCGIVYDLADELEAETPEPASPRVRGSLETFATFGEMLSGQEAPNWRHADTAKRLATEARAALAKPQADIVAELVAVCERSHQVFEQHTLGNTLGEHLAGIMVNRLAEVIAKAKG